MGLSKEERFTGIVRAIHQFDDILESLKSGCYRWDTSDRLESLLEDLWPAFLSQQGNNAYWILGSDQLSGEVRGSNLLQVALLSIKKNHLPDEMEIEIREFHNKSHSDVFAYLYVHAPDIIKILDESPSAGALQAFFLVERAFYYLNRYADAFQKNYKELGAVLSKIWGATFRILQEDQNLLSAYCIHNLLEIVLPHRKDIVSQWWQKHALHHANRVGSVELEEVLALWKQYQPLRHKKISEEERILITLKIMGRRFHYAHQHKDLLTLISARNKRLKKANRIPLKKIKEALRACLKAYAQNKKAFRASTDYKACWLTDNSWEE